MKGDYFNIPVIHQSHRNHYADINCDFGEIIGDGLYSFVFLKSSLDMSSDVEYADTYEYDEGLPVIKDIKKFILNYLAKILWRITD